MNCRLKTRLNNTLATAARALLAACLAAPLAAAADRAPAGDSATWASLRAGLFGQRPIAPGGAVIALDAPQRADDAAVVPIAIRALAAQSPAYYVKTITLLVEKNPVPMAGVFHFTPQSGRAGLETRIRVEEYSWVRAIAEMSDGKLFMASRFVKASGGCSAPAGKDAAGALARAGKIRLAAIGASGPGQPQRVQLMVSHPNNSGMAMDQVTRLYEPAWYVRRIRIGYPGQPVMHAELTFSISENPHFRFYVLARANQPLQAQVEDSKNRVFTSSLEPGRAAGPPAAAP